MRRMLTLIAACVLVLTGCGSDDTEPAAGEGSDVQAQAEATLALADGDLGEILVDADGNTLYMFVPDQEANGEPTCYDDCADAWPAFEAIGDPTAGTGLDQSLLGVVARKDGSDQVTYNDLPLYYFSGDKAAGDTNGQGLNDVWWVLSAEGEPIKDTEEAKKDGKADSEEGVGY